MNKLTNVLRKQSGYISIETVIVAGLIIGMGAVTISKFRKSAAEIVEKAITQVEAVQDVQDVQNVKE